MVVPSVLSPEPLAPDSPHASLVHSALPLPEPRVSGCKQNFVHCPFKRLSAFLAISSCQQKPYCFSHPRVIWDCFPSSGALGWGAQLRVQPPHFSMSNPHSAAACGSPANPLAPPYCLPVLLRCRSFFHKSLIIRLLSS